MITGIHALIFSDDAEGTRSFFRDTLGFPAVDAGDGWRIFALPPAELGVHPAGGGGHHELYLMCDDVRRTVAELETKGVEFTKPISDEGFGLVTWMKAPGGDLALYEPKHPTALVTDGGLA